MSYQVPYCKLLYCNSVSQMLSSVEGCDVPRIAQWTQHSPRVIPSSSFPMACVLCTELQCCVLHVGGPKALQAELLLGRHHHVDAITRFQHAPSLCNHQSACAPGPYHQEHRRCLCHRRHQSCYRHIRASTWHPPRPSEGHHNLRYVRPSLPLQCVRYH